MNENRKMKIYAILGMAGSVFFQVGDCLLYLWPDLGTGDIEPLWAEMPECRFTVSTILGLIGAGLMLFGFWSLYQMTVKTCGAKMRRFMLLSGRAGMSKWFVLVSPVGAVLLGVLWRLIFCGTVIEGAWGACESLGEGLLYLVAYIYWRKNLILSPSSCAPCCLV